MVRINCYDSLGHLQHYEDINSSLAAAKVLTLQKQYYRVKITEIPTQSESESSIDYTDSRDRRNSRWYI